MAADRTGRPNTDFGYGESDHETRVGFPWTSQSWQAHPPLQCLVVLSLILEHCCYLIDNEERILVVISQGLLSPRKCTIPAPRRAFPFSGTQMPSGKDKETQTYRWLQPKTC